MIKFTATVNGQVKVTDTNNSYKINATEGAILF